MVECPDCEKQFHGSTCPTCGWSTKTTKATRPEPVPEAYRPWSPPEGVEVASKEVAMAAIAEIKRLLARAPLNSIPSTRDEKPS